MNLEIGRIRDTRGADESCGAIVLGHQATGRLEVTVEIHSERADHAAQTDVLANAGLRWRVNDRGTLLVSSGRFLRDDLGDHRSTVGYLGWQMNL